MPNSRFNEYTGYRFRQKVDSALETIRKILDETRTPAIAADVDHTYDDKFGLVEFLTNLATAAEMNVLERLGVDETKLSRLMELSDKGKHSVTLRLSAFESCEFVKEETVEVEGTHQHLWDVTETKADGSTETKSVRSKVLTKVKEYHWKFCVEYEMYAFVGSDPEKSKVLVRNRASSCGLVTTGNKESPRPSKVAREPVDVPLTWMLQNLTENERDVVCSFTVDRSSEACRTPRRNDDVEGAIKFFDAFSKWSSEVKSYFIDNLARDVAKYSGAEPKAHEDVRSSINADSVFVPVVPLFEEREASAAEGYEEEMKRSPVSLVSMPNQGTSRTPLLPVGDINRLLEEQCRSIDENISALKGIFPVEKDQKIISIAEASVSVLLLHSVAIGNCFADGVAYIEGMLRSQLVAAIGKEVHPKDFSEYMRFHHRKLFLEEFTPRPFCYTIRRPEHYPDGTLSIMNMPGNGEESQVIETITRKLKDVIPMTFPINAATSVEFTGQRYMHALVTHDFRGSGSVARTQLVARARQFSSFLLLIGKISGPDTFDPQHAIILQNKDELLLPLLMEQLPTPKEFKDAIESLSPEQKRFATAFRNMQLESSVFALCVIQLKPQLEALLGLPADSLTKEIRLTQDLLELFIKYQIPSDLLTYSGDENVSLAEKVSVVKGHVSAVQEMIADAKEKQLDEAEQEADMRFEIQQEEMCAYGAPQQTQQSLLHRNARSGSGRVDHSHERSARFGFGSSSAAAPFCATPLGVKSATAPPISHSAAPDPFGATPAGVGFATAPPVSHSAAPAPPAASLQSQPRQPQIPQGKITSVRSGSTAGAHEGTIDFTTIPRQLDSMFEALDEDAALRPTIIKAGPRWEKKSHPNLLTQPKTDTLHETEQKTEKDKAFDLLDALSRSGTLPIACAELHVMVAATHCFEQSLMDTVVQRNINPIEKFERSMLIVTSVIHGTEAVQLLKDEDQRLRVTKYAPMLLTAPTKDGEDDMMDASE